MLDDFLKMVSDLSYFNHNDKSKFAYLVTSCKSSKREKGLVQSRGLSWLLLSQRRRISVRSFSWVCTFSWPIFPFAWRLCSLEGRSLETWKEYFLDPELILGIKYGMVVAEVRLCFPFVQGFRYAVNLQRNPILANVTGSWFPEQILQGLWLWNVRFESNCLLHIITAIPSFLFLWTRKRRFVIYFR